MQRFSAKLTQWEFISRILLNKISSLIKCGIFVEFFSAQLVSVGGCCWTPLSLFAQMWLGQCG